MTSHVSQLDIRNLSNMERNERMTAAVQDEHFPALHFNPGPFPETCHLFDKAVLRIRLPEFVEENVVAGLVGLPSQPAAHSQDSGRHRDRPRPGFTLPSNRLVLRNDPEFLFHIDPSPQQGPHFSRPATRGQQSEQKSPEVAVSVFQESGKLFAGNDSLTAAGCRLVIGRQRMNVYPPRLDRPTQHPLNRGNRVLNCRGAEVLRVQRDIDFLQVFPPQLAHPNPGPDDLQGTEDGVTEVVVRCRLFLGFDEVQVCVRQFRERGVPPVAVADDAVLGQGTNRVEFAASSDKILVELLPLAADGGTPPARCPMQPGLVRNFRFASHFGSPMKVGELSQKTQVSRPGGPHSVSQPVSYGSAAFHYPFSIEQEVQYCQGFMKSGRLDLNQRPLGPEQQATVCNMLYDNDLQYHIVALYAILNHQEATIRATKP